jgi:hypothetical protein
MLFAAALVPTDEMLVFVKPVSTKDAMVIPDD